MTRTVPFVGLALGAICGTIGAVSLAALLTGGERMSRRDRTTIGVVSIGLISAGTVLTTLSHSQLSEDR